MPVSAFSVVCLLMVLLAVTNAVYINYYDEEATMECRNDEHMYFISSVHHNRHEDRRWKFYCRRANMGSCSWSGYVNDFDELLAYTCPGNRVVAGMYSYHNNGAEDRRFKFKCCDVVGQKTENCYFTGFANVWDGQLTVNAPGGKAIKGAASEHNNKKEDRRWKFFICSLVSSKISD